VQLVPQLLWALVLRLLLRLFNNFWLPRSYQPSALQQLLVAEVISTIIAFVGGALVMRNR